MSEPTRKAPSPANAALFRTASFEPEPEPVSEPEPECEPEPELCRADAEEPLLPVPLVPSVLSPLPWSPAFTDTTPMTTNPTTALSAILPFMPMAVSPLGRADRRCSTSAAVRWVNESRLCEPSQHDSQYGRRTRCEPTDLAWLGML